jgi:hypothetical protein
MLCGRASGPVVPLDNLSNEARVLTSCRQSRWRWEGQGENGGVPVSGQLP